MEPATHLLRFSDTKWVKELNATQRFHVMNGSALFIIMTKAVAGTCAEWSWAWCIRLPVVIRGICYHCVGIALIWPRNWPWGVIGMKVTFQGQWTQQIFTQQTSRSMQWMSNSLPSILSLFYTSASQVHDRIHFHYGALFPLSLDRYDLFHTNSLL